MSAEPAAVPRQHDPQHGDPLDRRLADAGPSGRVAVLVEHLAPKVATTSLDWIGDLSAAAARHEMSLPELRTAATDLAWLARDAGQRFPGAAEEQALRGAPALDRLVLAYVHGQRLRFDFKFEALQSQSHRWLAEFDGDALIVGLAAFGALGSRSGRGLELYRQAVDAPDVDAKTRHVCMHGLWFADHLPDQAELMLELSQQLTASSGLDANVFFRRAFALRKLGRFEQALDEIDRAIAMLGPGHNAVHQDYVRERELIVVTRQLHGYAQELTRAAGDTVAEQAERRIKEASAALTEKVETAQRVVAEGTLKVVEILGLFVTLAGFVIGSGAVVVKAGTFGERAAAMGIVLVGCLLFFALLRFVTTFRRR
ncbi:hypothetical protein Cme02nite_02300 [Catellatospora methionotrophica]|uniref:Tetratricopeptide repeat protein n=1 Tax=Catellatospora methionotrophica TaxID=121620 RepID=A0A8J3PD05_9ACTN|nr:tetratricopeptide repeat protein [Catellatospora methionotrophica]GIG11898.1 hypothetical protein Cme02nite_02300 [Catellatospora methionotrophica]